MLNRGTPQIEVTFEVDANGILNVKAEDKGTGKSEKITITNDKGRLSQEEIDRMVREAEEFAEEDKKVKEKIDARNSLETYVYNMKNQINDKDKLADKLESDEKEKIETAVKEALEWLDDNQSAEKEDYDEKLKEVEAVCNPIITAVYQRSGGAPGAGSDGGEDDDSHDELWAFSEVQVISGERSGGEMRLIGLGKNEECNISSGGSKGKRISLPFSFLLLFVWGEDTSRDTLFVLLLLYFSSFMLNYIFPSHKICPLQWWFAPFNFLFAVYYTMAILSNLLSKYIYKIFLKYVK